MALTIDQLAARKLGIYRDLPAREYHSIFAASSTTLRALMRSPAHAMTRKEPTPALIFGNACHLAVLQPDLFAKEFAVADQCSAKTGKGKQCSNGGKACRGGSWFCGIHDPGDFDGHATDERTILSKDDYDRARRVADAVRAHPAARELLDARTDTELSAFWLDPATGVYCKARADITIDTADCITDLKTTMDASPEGFAGSLWKFRYDIQAGHYTRGMAATHKFYHEFRFIAVEKEDPFAVGVYSLSIDDIIPAIDQLDILLRKWKACDDEGDAGWQRGYSEKVVRLELTGWAKKKRDEALDEDEQLSDNYENA